MRTFAVRMFGSSDCADVADRSLQHPVGIGVQADLGAVAEAHAGQVVFVHVADDPDGGQVGNRERICAQTLHARGVGYLLVGDHSRNRRKDIDHAVRVIGVVAQQPEMLRHGFDVHFGLVFGVLRHLKIVQGDGAVRIQVLRALQLGARKHFIGKRLPVIRKRAGYVVAADGQQQLTLFDRVAEPRVDRHDAARTPAR